MYATINPLSLKLCFFHFEVRVKQFSVVSWFWPTACLEFDPRLPGCETFEQLLETFRLSRGMLGEIMSAYEFLDSECMRLLNGHLKLPNPISGSGQTVARCRSASVRSGVTPHAVPPRQIVPSTSSSRRPGRTRRTTERSCTTSWTLP